uniref:hypothetical protein n=1 Tax=Azospirillum argentinense TaxID=2970906 RepID=UPI001585F274|nr:hypothetical protein [Azospirillum argentinense]
MRMALLPFGFSDALGRRIGMDGTAGPMPVSNRVMRIRHGLTEYWLAKQRWN